MKDIRNAMSGQYSRRWFLGTLAAGTALSGCRAFLAPGRNLANAKLRFGVLSDIHIRCNNPEKDERWFRAALEYFRDHGADAVLIAGDMADMGLVAELELVGSTWRQVFPEDRAPDGRRVEKLFVYGNHDTAAWKWLIRDKAKREDPAVIAENIGMGNPQKLAECWKKCFDEEYAPIWIKDVKGYKFIGAQWGCWEGGRLDAFLSAHAAELKGTKPFFYVQHAHPKDTCFGHWAWGHDDGSSTAALGKFPNAVAFSGHSHYPLTDERTVWQGSFTSVNTASLRYSSHDYNLRDTKNFGGNESGYADWKRPRVSPALPTEDGQHGMLVEVSDSEIVIHRREFRYGESLGEDWVIPLGPSEQPYDYARHAARRSAPEFAAGATLKVERTEDDKEKAVVVTIPHAPETDGIRVFEYEVTATVLEDDIDVITCQKRVIAAGYHLPGRRAEKPTECWFSAAELALGARMRFDVRPVECFGRKGAPISAVLERPPKK